MNRKLAFAFSVVIPIVAFVCYINSLHGDFVFDDNFAVLNNGDVKSDSPLINTFIHDFWGQDITKDDSHKSYRPLTILSFRLNHYLHEFDTFGYHLMNVILHSMVSWLVFVLVLVIFGERERPASGSLDSMMFSVAMMSALLFATHPIHTEAVSGIVGRAELLCAVFYIIGFICYHKAIQSDRVDPKLQANVIYPWITFICLICATLSKETGYTGVGVIMLWEFLVGMTPSWKFRVSIVSMFGFIYIFLRKTITVSFTLDNYRHLENPIAFTTSATTRWLSMAHLHTEYFWKMIYPRWLSADWSFDALPLVDTFYDIRNLRSLLFYLFILVSGFGSLICIIKGIGGTSAKILLWLVAFGVAAFFPASNILFYVGTMLAERLMYLPSIPYCILVSWLTVFVISLLRKTEEPQKRTVQLVYVPDSEPKPKVTTVRKRVKSHREKSTNPVEVYTLTLPTDPVGRSHTKPFNWMQWLLFIVVSASVISAYTIRTVSRDADWVSEEALFLDAMVVAPGSAKVWQNIGILHRRSQNWKEALAALHRAKKIEPVYCDCDYWIGITELNNGNIPTALDWLNRALECKYMLLQTVTTLRTIYQELISSRPRDPSILEQWGAILAKIDRKEDAAAQYFQAGVLHHESDDVHEANRDFIKALDLDPKGKISCRVSYWIASSYFTNKKFEKAKPYLEYAASDVCRHDQEVYSKASESYLGLLIELFQKDNLSPILRRDLGNQLIRIGEIDKGIKQLYESGIIFFNSGFHAEALTLFERVEELEEEHHVIDMAGFDAFELALWTGSCHLNVDPVDFAKARHYFQIATQSDQEHVRNRARETLTHLISMGK